MSPRPTAPELTDVLFDPERAALDHHPTYDRLRAEAPVVWHEDPGIWVLTRHADVMEVNRDTRRFSSTGGVIPIEIGIEYPSPPTMMHTDPPEHTRLRQAVALGFRPSRIRALEAELRGHVDRLMEAIPSGEPFDVVEAIAAPLPLMVICDLLGLPSSDWPLFWEWSDGAIPGASDMSDERRGELNAELEALLRRKIAGREGLSSELAGEGLGDDDIYILFNQLLIAGNETSRNLISGGLLGLANRPEQWQLLQERADLLDSAVEELLRWTTPVVSFMRTTTVDTEVGGEQIHAGDPVLMMWAAANRDEAEFGPTAGELRIDRSPNHHLAFGFGPHFCVGAALGRLEARLVLEAMRSRFPLLDSTGEERRSPSTVIAGHQRVVLTGGGAAA